MKHNLMAITGYGKLRETRKVKILVKNRQVGLTTMVAGIKQYYEEYNAYIRTHL